MAGVIYRLLLFVALATGSVALWLGYLHSTPYAGDKATGIPGVVAQSVFAPASTPSAAQTTGFGADVTTHACRGCTVELSADGGVRARVATNSLQRNAYAVLDLGRRANNGQVIAHDVIGLGVGETPVALVHVLRMSDAEHRVIFELVADPRRRLLLYSPAGGLRERPLDIATGAILPNDGVSGVAVDVVKVNNGVSVYVNGVRTVRLTGLRGATTSAPRYLAAGVVSYNAPAGADPLTAVHTQVSVTNDTPPPVSAAPPEPTAAPAPAPSPIASRPALASTLPPTISGESVPGDTLSADAGQWTDSSASFTYTWQRCDTSGVCAAIDGATHVRYTLTSDDVGTYIRVRVTATSGTSTTTVVSAAVGPVAPAAPVPITAPAINGVTVVGSILTADAGTWSDPAATLTYSWRRCDDAGNCVPIDGATDTTYTLASDDVGSRIRVRVTASNAGGQNTAASPATGQIGPAAPSDLVAPSISGAAIVGSTLTADPGSWSDPSAIFGFAWGRCDSSGVCVPIAGATSATYTLTGNDLGASIIVTVTASNAGGQNTAVSPATGQIGPAAPSDLVAPSISGAAIVGSTLTADPGSWSDPSAIFGFAWGRCDSSGVCVPIAGATSATYTLTGNDLGASIIVTVTASNAGGQNTAASPATGQIGPAAPSDLVAPSISGAAIVGSTLTADPGSWSDPSAIFGFAWGRCDSSGVCVPIAGATSATYTLTGNDLGASIIVTVTASNAGGQNTAASPATGQIGPAAPSDLVAPSISGAAIVGSTLTADPGSWSDPSAIFGFAWGRCDSSVVCVPIAGATSATYTLTRDDLGASIIVTVTASNAGGQNTAASPATAKIASLDSSAEVSTSP